jgi:hypothetical protein
MSELQRAFAKAKLSGLPPVIPNPLVDIPLDEEDEETDGFGELLSEQRDDDSSSASSASSASSTGTIRPSHSNKLFARPFRLVKTYSRRGYSLIVFQISFEIELVHTYPNIMDLLLREDSTNTTYDNQSPTKPPCISYIASGRSLEARASVYSTSWRRFERVDIRTVG